MTNKEQVKRNLGLTFDFVHQLIEQPEHLAKLPEKFTLQFEEKDFSKSDEERRGKKMKSVRVKSKFDIAD
ncbi:MAG: hypothetical protein SH857_02580 [Chitinophagales bacterium]|nr:hypothetical protein [Chitinophagales bacterium]